MLRLRIMSVSDLPTGLDVRDALAGPGYFSAPLLGTDEIVKLRDEFDRLGLRGDHGFFSSNKHASRATAVRLDGLIRSVVEPKVRALLPDHRAFLGAFISKGSHHGSTVQFHQDWTYTDERTHRAVAVWIPLVDVDRQNGVLEVVPDSHRGPTATFIRPSGSGNPLAGDQASLARRAVASALEAGTGLLYDPAVAHGSEPNTTDRVRPAVAIAFAPQAADLVHFHLDPWHRLRGYRVDARYFTVQTFAGCPQGYPSIDPWDEIASVRPARRRYRPVGGGLR